MIFSDRDIKRLIQERAIVVEPAPNLDLQLGSCSLDLRLSHDFSMFEHNRTPFIDVRDSKQVQHITKVVSVNDGDFFVLHPGTFVLAVTIERLELPDNIVARLEGRSSLGRLGVVVHATASIIDPGWRGKIVLELANHGLMPVALYPGMRICSVTFEPLSSPVDMPYWKKAQAKYMEQEGPAPSRISDDPDVIG